MVFFGTPDFAVPSLKALIHSGEEIGLVVTQPDKVKGRGHLLSSPPVKVFAEQTGLKVVQPVSLREETLREQLAALRPEFGIVVAYGKILPKTILDLPARGCINVHASLLPKYRGAAPIAWAIIHGEDRTGVTTMLMNEGLDTGDVLMQRELEIGGEETTGSLTSRLADLGASLLVETIRGVRDGSVRPVPQAGETLYAPPLRKSDGRIDWSKSAVVIHRFVRGMQPWPGAYCEIASERITLLRTKPVEGGGTPGVISEITNDFVLINTGLGRLAVLELQPAGRKPMSASAFIHGRRLTEWVQVR
jgi:methionyl-tRNA formyltransferase